MSKGRWFILVVVTMLAGCGQPISPSALPTLTLVPPTETIVPTSAPARATDDPELTSPESLLTARAPTLPAAGTSTVLPEDPIAAELVLIAQQQVADLLGISVRRVRLVSVEAVRWDDSSLGCPQADQTYTPIEVDGYRIELRAADETYRFHTDFDRVISCDTALETDG